jgi:glutamyl-tRNA(Gln) amidotransferase subunit D
MLHAGAIEGADMLPEVALVKLMWLLANQPDSVGSLMGQSLAGEISFSTPITV